MPEAAWAHVMSLELGWMAPGAAKAFVADCVASGLLVPETGEDQLRLGFDATTVTIPRGFRPPTDLAATSSTSTSRSSPSTSSPPSTKSSSPASPAPPVDLFPALVARIAKERSTEKAEVMNEVTKVQERFGGKLSADAAAVRVAMAHGVDVADDAEAALRRITST